MKRNLFSLLLIASILPIYAQNSAKEVKLGSIRCDTTIYEEGSGRYKYMIFVDLNNASYANGKYQSHKLSETEIYKCALNNAKKTYGNKKKIKVVNVYPRWEWAPCKECYDYDRDPKGAKKLVYNITADVYALVDPVAEAGASLSTGLEKALKNIAPGSRLSVSQMSIAQGLAFSEDDCRDMITDYLIEKGYRVVAKEFLQKLYEEQQQQKSEIYNNQTTVQTNNFSAVGYYLNLKITDKNLRIQIINVSTGEYEGTSTVNF